MGSVRGSGITFVRLEPVFLALCFICGLYPGCGRGGDRLTRVRVTGASTLYPIVQLAAEELKRDGVIQVEAQAGGSTRGFEDTLAGRNDLGAMARELTAEEARQVLRFPIAYDGIGVVVHASNPLTSLTTNDLRRVYRKEITNWKEFGGTTADIVAVTKAEGHATLESFLNHTGLSRQEVKADVACGDNAQVIRVVANTVNAIAYVSLGEVLHAMEIGMPLKMVQLDGIAPTVESVADGSYPMSRTLYLVSKEEPAGGSLALLEFLGSQRGRAIIERGRYVPLP